MPRLLLLLFYSLLSISVLAQTEIKYRIQQFTTDNGLPSNGIKGLQWDEQTGFLWVATEAGVARFNGLDFANFTKENTPGITHERMAYLVKNNKGAIYGSDVGSNFVAVHANSLTAQPLPNLTEIIGYKKRFFLSASGAALQKKVLEFMNKTKETAWADLIQVSDSSAVIIDSKNNFYYVSEKQNSAEPITVPANSGNGFALNNRFFIMNQEHQLLVAKNNIQTFEPVKIVTAAGEPVPVNLSNFLLYWDNGMSNPILFSGSNAWLLYYKNDVIRAKLICTVIPSYSFIRFAQYSEKNKTLFIGTDSKGITIISENRVTLLKKNIPDIRDRNAYYSQVELADGTVLTNEAHIIGTSGNAAAKAPITGKFDYSVYSFGDSVLFYAQRIERYKDNFIHSYNYRTGKTTAYTKIPVLSNFAMTWLNGKFYIATYWGIGYLDGDSARYLFRPPPPKKNIAAPYAMTEFSPGVLGVASCDGVILYHLNKNTTDTLLKPFGYCFRSFWKYKDYVFIGSYGKGYYIWKNGALKAMPLDKNNFLLYAHCFVPDKYGYCWISTNRGLFKAQLSDLIDAYENDRAQVYYHYLGRNDGMEITEMNGGCAPCALVMKNNTLSFPTMDGLLWVNSETAIPLLPEGNIFIDEFLASYKKINPDSLSQKSLPSAARDIVIRLGFSSWCNKENIYLEYRLNNSQQWTAVDVNRGAFIRLNNLAPGRYKILVRKLNGFGINNYSYKEIKFTISTPWTRRWWFYVLCGLVVFGLISLYLRWRTRQYQIRQRKLEKQVAEKTKELKEQNEVLEKNNTIKTRLISIISHDIVTPLKFVTVAGKNLIEKKDQMPEDLQQETLQEITNTSQELQLLSTNILNWIKYQNENRRMAKEKFNLHELVNQVLGILQSLARQKNLRIENRVHPDQQIQQYYEPLKILVYNLLTNAIHFTEKGTIVVAATEQNGNITVSVKDEGVGMTPEQIQRLMAEDVVITSANVDNKKGHGLGYLIIKDLLKTMGATINIESRKGEGATVEIRMEK